MSLARFRFRVPLAIQVSMVAALFVAALVVLWSTGAAVVARERRRSQAKELLENAGNDLAARGRTLIARAGEFPNFPEEPSREELDGQLRATATLTLAKYAGIDVEGGYLVLRFKSFLGTAVLKPSATLGPVEPGKEQSDPPELGRGESGLPEQEAGLIDIQVDAAIRKRKVLFSVEELEGERPVTVAIRTAPLEIEGRVVGASWVMTRLVDPLFVDRSLRGYQLASGLALAGIALAFALTAGLGEDRSPSGGRTRSSPGRIAAQRAPGGARQAPRRRRTRGSQSAGRNPLDGSALAARRRWPRRRVSGRARP